MSNVFFSPRILVKFDFTVIFYRITTLDTAFSKRFRFKRSRRYTNLTVRIDITIEN